MTTWQDRGSIGLRSARSSTRFAATPKGIAFHWEGVKVDQGTLEQSQQNLRTIQRAHMNNAKEGYVDIAYNFAIDHLGNIFELRGWNIQSGANGNTQANREYIAVCYLGGPGNSFTDAAKEAFQAFRKEASARGIGNSNKPHSDFKATQCPGDEIRSFIATLSGVAPVPSTPPSSSPVPSSGIPAFPGVTRKGSKGEAVRKVQQRLKDRGWKIGVDGDFGPQTESIVKAFQKEKNITADGIVGPVTWGKLWTAPIS